ncbi:creatininase family protein [Thermococcus sp. MV5]|uniref:creatininase family protein n=1 Tax=Thermococcus sp. MV5 TaxID=1638272 RepID=UPI00143930C7|nr:creatininase family protein [Thermococcus sp. MV5]NJE25526.1 creatininase family protein [Thermococcus sp. MV5]
MKMEELSWEEFAKMKKSIRAVLIPVGSVEAHGKHLPLGTDVFAPLEISRRIEKKLKKKGIGIFIAPPVWYGHSFVLNVYPGTINVKADTLRRYIRDILDEFALEGFKELIVLNGHGGNIYPIVEAAEEIAEKHDVEILLINWWIDFKEEILKVCSSQGHAGEDETSVMLVITPELAKMEKAKGEKRVLPVRVIKRDIGLEVFPNGINDDPRGATREKGEQILEIVSDKIAEILVERL